MMKIEPHKHCVFCGELVDFSRSTECKSSNNTTEPDTTGHKQHVTLG